MTSKTVEDMHEAGIRKLLLDKDLECVRAAQESPVPSESYKVVEEEGLTDQTVLESSTPIPVVQQDEEVQVTEEEKPAEIPVIFPAPSLRKLLPDKVRKIQAENSIHVLPEVFRTDFDLTLIPKIATTLKSKYIDILAELTGCSKYKSSLAEYWFLDTLANLLKRAQAADMSKQSQAVLIHWFCEWMKEMQHFDAADRRRMIRRFQDNMLAAATFIGEHYYIPKPDEIGVFYKSIDDKEIPISPKSVTESVLFEKIGYECSLVDLASIIHYIFDLFSTDYQYNLVRSVFTFTPDYIHIDAPYQMQVPKKMYTPLKPAKKDKPPIKRKEAPKGKKLKDVETDEFLALQELKLKELREIEERDNRYRESWNLRSHILPLNMAVTDELFNKYWPPPPPPEPEPVQTSEPKKKGSHHKKMQH